LQNGPVFSFDHNYFGNGPGKEKESVIRLARVGFDKISGCLQGGFDNWKKQEKIDLIINVEPDELAMDIPFDVNLVVIDVRKPNEFAEGHIRGYKYSLE
jgi:hypothetical protein